MIFLLYITKIGMLYEIRLLVTDKDLASDSDQCRHE